MLTQKQRKAAEAAASGPKLTPEELAKLEREEIAAWLEARPGDDWDKDTNKRTAEELAAEAEARKAAGPVELTTRWGKSTGRKVANPVAAWQAIERAEASRLELADFAAEVKRLEREAKRRRPDRFTVAAVKRSAQVILAELPAAEVERLSGQKRAASDYAVMAEVAAQSGVEVAELAEALEVEKLLAADQTKPLADVQSEVGYAAELTPAEVLERKARAAEVLKSREAVAGRKVLDSIGPRASAVVVSNVYTGGRITVAEVKRVPDLALAEARAAKLAGPLAEAREALELAEKKLASKKRLNAEARKVAEADADRKAAVVRKLAARFDRAEAARAEAEALQPPKPELGKVAVDVVAVPLASFKLAEAAAEAAALEIPDRADRMPSAFVERGPAVRTSASWSGDTKHGGRAAGVSDPTGDSAAALVDGYRAAVAAAEAAEAKLAARVNQSREVFKANQRSAYKAREAARKREARRNAKNKR